MIKTVTTRTDNVITISRIEIKAGKGIRISRKRVGKYIKRVKII